MKDERYRLDSHYQELDVNYEEYQNDDENEEDRVINIRDFKNDLNVDRDLSEYISQYQTENLIRDTDDVCTHALEIVFRLFCIDNNQKEFISEVTRVINELKDPILDQKKGPVD